MIGVMREFIQVSSGLREGREPKHILVLDDDADLSELLRVVLEWRSYEVTIARSGAEAMKAILAREYDVIVYDIANRVPVELFYLAVQRTKKELCRRLVLITHPEGDAKAVQFVASEGLQEVHKPLVTDELFASVSTVLTETQRLNLSEIRKAEEELAKSKQSVNGPQARGKNPVKATLKPIVAR
jgi:DNA-binding NtrC family response regulator